MCLYSCVGVPCRGRSRGGVLNGAGRSFSFYFILSFLLLLLLLLLPFIHTHHRLLFSLSLLFLRFVRLFICLLCTLVVCLHVSIYPFAFIEEEEEEEEEEEPSGGRESEIEAWPRLGWQKLARRHGTTRLSCSTVTRR